MIADDGARPTRSSQIAPNGSLLSPPRGTKRDDRSHEGTNGDETSLQGEIAMSPDTRAAIEAGRPLNRRQFHEFIDHEAKAAGMPSADAAISRARSGVEPSGYREMRLRLSINTYLRA